jgi:signal transduction histidine kinase
MAYQFAEYNLNDLMVEALDEQWANAKQKKIGLVGQACEDGLWVQMDRNLMWRALVNIISNALSACQGFSNEAQVELSTRREGDFAVIQIQDNGPGIAPDRQASLFEPFVQGQGLKRTGAGLGLAFVKTVLDQHHGQVRVHSPVVESAVPHGTRFELWLPILPDPVSEDDAPLPSV